MIYLVYAAAATFVAASIFRAIGYSRAPQHVRWELQPVPRSAVGRLFAMLSEVVFFHALWKFNRRLWLCAYPFHLGLYVLVLAGVLRNRPAALIGATLVIVGAAGLLSLRLIDSGLRNFTTPADIFNLLFFIAAAGLFLAGWTTAALIAGSLLVAYIPFTHMAHFIAKYFTYHSIRWDDRAGVSLARYLTYRPTWAAPHIGADGKTSWGEIATGGKP